MPERLMQSDQMQKMSKSIWMYQIRKSLSIRKNIKSIYLTRIKIKHKKLCRNKIIEHQWVHLLFQNVLKIIETEQITQIRNQIFHKNRKNYFGKNIEHNSISHVHKPIKYNHKYCGRSKSPEPHRKIMGLYHGSNNVNKKIKTY